jgi:hypothetical protein
MTCARVQTAREEAGHEEIDEGAGTGEVPEEKVEGELDDEVVEVPFGGCLGADEAWAECVEEDLEGAVQPLDEKGREIGSYAKKVLPRTLLRQTSSRREGRSVSMPSSPRCLWCSIWYFCAAVRLWTCRIYVSDTHLESSRVRYTNRQIRKDSKSLVRADALESKIMCDFVDREKEVVVRGTADDVCREQEPRRERMGVSEGEADDQLDDDDSENEIFCTRLMAHKLGDLRVSLDNGLSPRLVGLLGHEPEKIGRVQRCTTLAIVDGRPRRRAAFIEGLCTAKVAEIGHIE